MREQLLIDSLETIIWNVDSFTGPGHQSPEARSGHARNQADEASSEVATDGGRETLNGFGLE